MPFWHPGTAEFIEELKKRGFSVVALDIWSFTYFDENEKYHTLVPKIFKGGFAKIYKRIFRKYTIKKYIKKSDIVDIQWCGYYYSKYISTIKNSSSKLIATLFGSDFYRATDQERNIQSKIFEEADIVVIGPNMKEDFIEVFPHIENKISFGQYGSKRLDIVDEINTAENRKAFREKYSIPQDKIVVSVGYNAKKEQQHLKFLKLLDSLRQDKKDKLLLFFPLTYGREGNYVNELKTAVSELKIDSYYLEKSIETGERWLSDEEISETKILSDITVNIQTTDALSSSIKEAMLANDVVLVGDWLPYGIYEEIGAFLIRSTMDDFLSSFENIIDDFEEFKSKNKNNRDVILKFASWNSVIEDFIDRYKN